MHLWHRTLQKPNGALYTFCCLDCLEVRLMTPGEAAAEGWDEEWDADMYQAWKQLDTGLLGGAPQE